MTRKVKKFYEEALKNEEFNFKFKMADSQYKKPNFFTDEIYKHLYTMVYEGYLIAKDEFDESKY